MKETRSSTHAVLILGLIAAGLFVYALFVTGLAFKALSKAQLADGPRFIAQMPQVPAADPIPVEPPAPATLTVNGMAEAISLIPTSTRIITSYPITDSRYVVLAETPEHDGLPGKWQSWFVDIGAEKATLTHEFDAQPSTFVTSLAFSPQSLAYGYFSVTREYGWEGPPTQAVEVFDSKTGALKTFVEWFGGGGMRIQKGKDTLNIAWHYGTACDQVTGGAVTKADGLTVNGTLVKFDDTVDVNCEMNEMAGMMMYDAFEKPYYSPEYLDKEFIIFQIRDGLFAKIDLSKMNAAGVAIKTTR